MARKITLTIPESLYKRLEKWRSGFNLSRMFQETVNEAIQKKEDFQKRLGEELNLNEIVTRLKREKQSWKQNMFRRGEREGRRWASSAHYTDLLEAVNRITSAKKPEWSQFLQIQPAWEGVSHSLKLRETNVTEASAAEAKKEFLKGWQTGVQEFWNLVKDKI